MATRERLVEAARRCFESNGYRATTLLDVATAADVDLATVRATFGTFGDAVYAVFDAVTDEVRPRYAALDAALVAPDPEPLAAWIDSFLDWWMANDAILTVFREAAVLDPAVARHVIPQANGVLGEIRSPFRGLSNDQRSDAGRTLQVLLEQFGQAAYEWYANGADPPPAER